MATLYEIYKVDNRNGNKKRMGDVVASTPAIAFKKWKQENGWKFPRMLKGKFMIIPQKMRAKYTYIKR